MRRTVSGADTGAIFVVLGVQVNEENQERGKRFWAKTEQRPGGRSKSEQNRGDG
jgi:hypothetical protein